MPIEYYALILLLLRVVSSGFLVRVLMIQLPLLKATNDKHLGALRRVLIALTAIMLLGNIIPIIIDVLTITGEVTRSSTVLSESTLIYGFSNAVVWLLGSIFLWLIYKVSGEVKV